MARPTVSVPGERAMSASYAQDQVVMQTYVILQQADDGWLIHTPNLPTPGKALTALGRCRAENQSAKFRIGMLVTLVQTVDPIMLAGVEPE